MSFVQQIQDTLAELVPIKQKELTALKKEHGNKVIGEVTVDQVRVELKLSMQLLSFSVLTILFLCKSKSSASAARVM